MTKKREMTQEETDRRHEAMVERGRKRFQKEAGHLIHYNYSLEDNPRLQVFNQVLKEQARKKVN